MPIINQQEAEVWQRYEKVIKACESKGSVSEEQSQIEARNEISANKRNALKYIWRLKARRLVAT